MRTHARVLMTMIPCLAMAAGAAAAIGQASIAPPGGFAQAGAYPSTCGCTAVGIGNDLQAGYGLGLDFDESAFSGDSSASASAAGTQGTVTLSVSGSADLGSIRAAAHNTHANNNPFVNGYFDGGWKDSFTVSHPALDGQAGFLVFRINAAGLLEVTGFSGMASIAVQPYKNNLTIPVNAHFSRGDSDALGTDRQIAQWGLSTDGQSLSRTVNGSASFSVPITFGQSFSLGVYARAAAGQRSVSGVPGLSTSTVDCSSTGVRWGGILSVLDASGGLVSGASIVSASGTPWQSPYNPCPADFNGDGFLDFFDIDAFLAAFESGDPAGDFNGDGFLDFFDADAFVAGFEAGC